MTKSPAPSRKLTVGDILAFPQVRAGLPQVLSDPASLERAVRWAHVIELVDPRRLLRGDELVMTTGYGIAESTADQRLWVERIASQGAAALAIELGVVFQNQIPAVIVQTASDVGLPLVVFQRRVAFVELTEVINRTIASHSARVVAQVGEMQERLMEMLAEHQSTGAMLDMVATKIQVPLILENARKEVMHAAVGGLKESRVFRALADLHRYEHGGVGETAHIEDLAHGYGRLVALPLDMPLAEEHQAIVRATAKILSIDLGFRTLSTHLSVTSQANLLEELADGQMPDGYAGERAELLGLTPGTILMPVVARLRRESANQLVKPWAEVAHSAQLAFGRNGLGSLVGAAEDELIGLIELSGELSEVRSAVASVLQDSVGGGEGDKPEIVIAFGSGSRIWKEIAVQLAHTRRRARTAELMQETKWYDAGESDLIDLLYDVRETRALADYAKAQIGLISGDDQRSATFRKTLLVLAEHGGRKASAAKALHLDRGGLYQRLERIEALLGRDLGDPRTLTSLYVALKAKALLEGDSRPDPSP